MILKEKILYKEHLKFIMYILLTLLVSVVMSIKVSSSEQVPDCAVSTEIIDDKRLPQITTVPYSNQNGANQSVRGNIVNPIYRIDY